MSKFLYHLFTYIKTGAFPHNWFVKTTKIMGSSVLEILYISSNGCMQMVFLYGGLSYLGGLVIFKV